MKRILVVGCFLLSAGAFAQTQQSNAQSNVQSNEQNNAQNNQSLKTPTAVQSPSPAPAPVPTPTPAPVPPVATEPVPAPAPDWQIVGIGSYSLCPKHLFVRGCGVAVFEAKVCAVGGRTSNGSECWAVWQHNGKLYSRFISARDFGAMQDFIARTQASCALQFTPKHPKRECYDGIP